MHCIVISAPFNNSLPQLPLNDADSPPYVTHLIDGSTQKVSRLSCFHCSWTFCYITQDLVIDRKWCTYRIVHIKKASWNGISTNQCGIFLNVIIKEQKYLVLIFLIFQQYIDGGTLVPGWQEGQNFWTSGISHHVSGSNLQCFIPPSSLTKGLNPRNPDQPFG